MWRSSCLLLRRTLKSAARCGPTPPLRLSRLCAAAAFSTEGSSCGGGGGGEGESISFAEAKRLMRLVNVEALKMKLGTDGKEVIGYSDLLQACEAMGVAKSRDEATAFARVLDEIRERRIWTHPVSET